MDWNAKGAIGEIVGAAAVVLTLGYLALRVKHARTAASDVNRLTRASGIRDWQSLIITDSGLREAWIKADGSYQQVEQLATELGVTVDEASKLVWACQYWWWLHWGQWASTKTDSDLQELKHLISNFYGTPPMITVWKGASTPTFLIWSSLILLTLQFVSSHPKTLSALRATRLPWTAKRQC